MLIGRYKCAFNTALVVVLLSYVGVARADEPVDLLTDADFRKASPAEKLATLKSLQDAKQTIRDEALIKGMTVVAYCVDKGKGDPVKEVEALVELVEMEKTDVGMPKMGYKRGHWTTELFLLPIADYLNQSEDFQKADGPGKIRILKALVQQGLRGRMLYFYQPVIFDSQYEAVKDVPIAERGMARLQIIKELQAGDVSWALHEHLVHDKTWAKAEPKQKINMLVKWRDAGLLGTRVFGIGAAYETNVMPWIIAALEADPTFIAADRKGKRERLDELVAQKVINNWVKLDEHFQLDDSERVLDIEARWSQDETYLSMTPLEQFKKIAKMRLQAEWKNWRPYNGLMRRALIAHLQADDGGKPPTLETEIRRFREVMEQLSKEMRRKWMHNIRIALDLMRPIEYQVNAAAISELKSKSDVFARAQATVDWYQTAYKYENHGNGDVAAWLWLSAVVNRTAGARAPNRGAARLSAINELEKNIPFDWHVAGYDTAFAAYEFAFEADLFGSKTMREAAELLAKASYEGKGNLSMQILEATCWIRVFERDDAFPKADRDARKVVYKDLQKKKLMSHHAAHKVERHFAGKGTEKGN